MSSIDFLVVGDANIDVVLGEMPRAPEVGLDTFASAYAITLGGSGAITAHGLGYMGSSVTLVTSIGDDLFAAFVLEHLGRASVLCLNQRDADGATGLSISFSHEGNRGFLSVPMPAAAWEEVPNVVRRLAPRHVHVSSHPHVSGLADCFSAIVLAARAAGSSISADPAGPARTGALLASFAGAPELDVLFVNETEARAFAGEPDDDDAARALLSLAELVVLKRGKHGASVFRRGANALHAPGLSVRCVDTTGAGDTFASAFLHAWRGEFREQLDVCLAFANAAAAASIAHLGGIRSHAELPALYRKYTEQLQTRAVNAG